MTFDNSKKIDVLNADITKVLLAPAKLQLSTSEEEHIVDLILEVSHEIIGTTEEIENAKRLIEECLSGGDYNGGGGRRGGYGGGRRRGGGGYGRRDDGGGWGRRDDGGGWGRRDDGGGWGRRDDGGGWGRRDDGVGYGRRDDG
ncbi:uncharacterized protein LOC131935302 [Physella acuta]|uniref:uncharacterized protein LOC131935302 n=1 Tax=Physella acuta TaxID=109671 RepID=UPI0027DD25B6|nr:uncharacterized protein LOC131935302 [Physella acuta]